MYYSWRKMQWFMFPELHCFPSVDINWLVSSNMCSITSHDLLNSQYFNRNNEHRVKGYHALSFQFKISWKMLLGQNLGKKATIHGWTPGISLQEMSTRSGGSFKPGPELPKASKVKGKQEALTCWHCRTLSRAWILIFWAYLCSISGLEKTCFLSMTLKTNIAKTFFLNWYPKCYTQVAH